MGYLGFPHALSLNLQIRSLCRNWCCILEQQKATHCYSSSTKAEYVMLTHALKDILWIHKLLTELSFIFSFSLPTTLFCNNQDAIRLSKDATFHGCTKHIDVHFHFICQTITSGHIVMQYCPTDDMISDIFTKSLA
jgi:hypothetical protein